ncbi:hypothetical protein AB1Y20_015555 [Prymnesium parvum]|uniref:Protein xylosyltransferase n=1 Tax=Prymnesium parvum TaxID=97485 RepID=A0AB34JYR0_PRYPA
MASAILASLALLSAANHRPSREEPNSRLEHQGTDLPDGRDHAHLQRKARALLRQARKSAKATNPPLADRPVLILIVGLMRSFRTTFHALRHSLITPNPHFTFDIVVSTDLNATCSNKDFETGCCIEPLERSPYPWAGLHGERLAAAIRETYSPYLIDLVSSASDDLPSRVRAGLAGRSLSRYFALLVSRPDVALVRGLDLQPVLLERQLLQHIGGRQVPQLQLEKECAARPGLSIVTGNLQRGVGSAENIALDRDHDFMYLACPPSALLPFFFRTRPGQLDCADASSCATDSSKVNCSEVWSACAAGQPPPIPPELRAAGCAKTACTGRAAHWCVALAQYIRDGQRLGTFDHGATGAVTHSVIVRSHAPGGCPLPPMPRACNYSIVARRPSWCSEKTDSRPRYMMSGKPGQRLVCTYFELRQLPVLSQQNSDWQSWVLAPRGTPRPNETAATHEIKASFRVIPRATLTLHATILASTADMMDGMDALRRRCELGFRYTSLAEARKRCLQTPGCDGVTRDSGILCWEDDVGAAHFDTGHRGGLPFSLELADSLKSANAKCREWRRLAASGLERGHASKRGIRASRRGHQGETLSRAPAWHGEAGKGFGRLTVNSGARVREHRAGRLLALGGSGTTH